MLVLVTPPHSSSVKFKLLTDWQLHHSIPCFTVESVAFLETFMEQTSVNNLQALLLMCWLNYTLINLHIKYLSTGNADICTPSKIKCVDKALGKIITDAS